MCPQDNRRVLTGLVAPYLAYIRQDARFHEGEATSSTHFAGLLSWSFDWLVTVDPHLHRHADLREIFTPCGSTPGRYSILRTARSTVPISVFIPA